MKKTFKLAGAIFICTIIFAVSELKARDYVGLNAGIEYKTHNIYRGMDYYIGAFPGLFVPVLNYSLYDLGLSFGIRGEITGTWLLGDREETWGVKGTEAFNSVSFRMNYRFDFLDAIRLYCGLEYYHHPKAEIGSYSLNMSKYDCYLSATFDQHPLRTRLAVTYTGYMDKKYFRGPDAGGVWGYGSGENKDIYVHLSFSRRFQLEDNLSCIIDAGVGYYDKEAYDVRIGSTKSADISDIELSARMSNWLDEIVNVYVSFHYVLVPGTQFKNSVKYNSSTGMYESKEDMHKFFAKFGVSCSI